VSIPVGWSRMLVLARGPIAAYLARSAWINTGANIRRFGLVELVRCMGRRSTL
jgi:hypothetical protein